jgi:hypothetical protein
MTQFCIPLYFLGRILFALVCPSDVCKFDTSTTGIQHLFENTYIRIEAGVVIIYIIVVIWLGLDDSIANIFTSKKELYGVQKLDL